MATAINEDFPSLLDLVNAQGPDGKIAKCIEILSRTNAVVNDAPWVEGNHSLGHEFTSELSLPTPGWRRVNRGIASTKGTEQSTIEVCGELVSRSDIDVKLLDLAKDRNAFRWSRDQKHVRALAYAAEDAFFYSNVETDSEEIQGFAPRLDDSSALDASGQIIKAGGVGADNTSIFIVGWGLDKVYAIHPQGIPGGLKVFNAGEAVYTPDGTAQNRQLRVARTDFQWSLGLCVADWRYVARICNIDISDLSPTADTIIPWILQGLNQIHDTRDCRPVIYMNRKIKATLDLQVRNTVKSGAGITYENIDGKRLMAIDGVPIKVTDAIVNTESLVP